MWVCVKMKLEGIVGCGLKTKLQLIAWNGTYYLITFLYLLLRFNLIAAKNLVP